jgi:hypothetical protein
MFRIFYCYQRTVWKLRRSHSGTFQAAVPTAKRIPEWLLCVKREDRDPQEYATIGNFLKLTASYSETFIIIDGLDECSGTGRKSVLDSINDLRFCQLIFKIFLTSRKKSDIARYFDREGILQVTTGSEGTMNDINCLIQQKTESLRQSHELLIESDLLFEKVVSVLVGVVCRPVEQSTQLKQVIRWVEPRVSKSWYLDSYYQTASWLFFFPVFGLPVNSMEGHYEDEQ